MNWDNVELIRNAQASAKERFKDTQLATNAEIEKALQSESAKQIALPRITEVEQMIFKMRSELIDYIVAHGLVDGLIWNGVLQPVESGKIVITKEMVEIMLRNLGYFDEADLRAFLETYLPDNHYVADAKYVHTDNNFTTPEKQKLEGIEDGAEVNKIIDLIFNGVSVLDDGTRVATITITPEDIKHWYESNPDTNAFTDAQKAKLAGVSDGAEVNRVDDVLVDGRSVLADDKKAKITPDDIKKAYEKNPDTNAFTDAEKADLATLKAWKPEAERDIADNASGIAEAKQSISDLDNEVNSIGGRVTTLETNTTQLRTDVDAMTEDAKKHLERKGVLLPLDFALPTEAGLYDADMVLRLNISYSTGTSTKLKVPIHGLVSASGTPIRLAGTLEGSGSSIYITQLVLTAGKAQGSLLTVTYPSYDTNEGANVTAIECTDTPTATYVKVEVGSEPPDLSKLVPYTGATNDVDIGTNEMSAGNITTTSRLKPGTTDTVMSKITFKNGSSNSYWEALAGVNNSSGNVKLRACKSINTNILIPVEVGKPKGDTDAATKKYVDDSVSSITAGILTESTKSDFSIAVVKFTKDVSATIDVRVWTISESGVTADTVAKTCSYGQNEIYILTREGNPFGVDSAHSLSDKSDRLQLSTLSGVKLYPIFNETQNTASGLKMTGSVAGYDEIDPTSYTVKYYKFV